MGGVLVLEDSRSLSLPVWDGSLIYRWKAPRSGEAELVPVRVGERGPREPALPADPDDGRASLDEPRDLRFAVLDVEVEVHAVLAGRRSGPSGSRGSGSRRRR